MKKGWSIIITIVLVAILLGAVSVGVGLMTGGDDPRDYMSQVYETVHPYVNWAIDVAKVLWEAVRSAAA